MNDKELIALCDEYFLGYWQQAYAGASPDCVYCGAMLMRDETCDHSASCPVVRYEEIKSKETDK